MSIDNVKRRGDCAHHHSDDNERKENIGKEPVILHDIAGRPSKAIETHACKDQLEDNQQNAELWLVFTMIEFHHELGHGIGQDTCQDQTDHGSYKRPTVQVAYLVLVEPKRWTLKNKSEDDTDEDSPTNDYTLNQASL
jgi:hypothetical protein